MPAEANSLAVRARIVVMSSRQPSRTLPPQSAQSAITATFSGFTHLDVLTSAAWSLAAM